MSVQVAAQNVLSRFAALGAGQQRSPEAVALVINSGLAHLSKPELEDALELLNGATTGLSMMTDQERQGMQAGLQIVRPPAGAGNAALGFQVAQSGLPVESASPADVDTWADISGRISNIESSIKNEDLSGFRALYQGLEAMKQGYRGVELQSSGLRQEIEDSVLSIVNDVVQSHLEASRQAAPVGVAGPPTVAHELNHALRADPSTFLITTQRAVSVYGKNFFEHAHRWAQGTTPGARQLRKSLKEHRKYAANQSEAAWTRPASHLSASRRAKLIAFERSSVTPIQLDVLKGHVKQAAAAGDGAFAFRLAFAARAAIQGINEAGVDGFDAWSEDTLVKSYEELTELCLAHVESGVAAFREVMVDWVKADPKGFLRERQSFSELASRWTTSFEMFSPRLDFGALVEEARDGLEIQALEQHLVELDSLAVRLDDLGDPRGVEASTLIREAAEQMAKSFTKTGPHASALRAKRNTLTAKVAGALIAKERGTFLEHKERRTTPDEALFFLATDRLDAWIAGGGKSEVEPWAGHLRNAAFDSKSSSPEAQRVWGELNQLRAESREHGWGMSNVGYESSTGPKPDTADKALSRISLGQYPTAKDFMTALEDAKDRGQSGHAIQAFRIAERVALALPSGRGISYPRDAQPSDVAEPNLAQRGLSQSAVSEIQNLASSIMQKHQEAAVLGEGKLAEECVTGSYLAAHHIDSMVVRVKRDPNLSTSVVEKLRARRDSARTKRKAHTIELHKQNLATQSDRIAALARLDKITVDTLDRVSDFVTAHDDLRFGSRAPDEPEAPVQSRAQKLSEKMPPIVERLRPSAAATADAVLAKAQATPETVEGFAEALKLTGSLRNLRTFQGIGADRETSDFDGPLHAIGTTLLARAETLLGSGALQKSDAEMNRFRSSIPYNAKGAPLVELREKIDAIFNQD